MIEQTHLRHARYIGTLTVTPHVEDTFCQGRLHIGRAIEGKGVGITIVGGEVTGCVLLYTDAVGKGFGNDVPQIDGISVTLHFFPLVDVEHHGNGLLARLLIGFVGHHLAVSGQDMGNLHGSIGKVLMLVTGSQQHRCRNSYA